MSDHRLEALSQNADFARATIQAALASDGRPLHAETAIASASRMSGTMLFRSFGLDLRNFRPGTVALSAAADTDGPMVMGLMFSALRAMGHDISDTRFKPTSLSTSVSELTLLQTGEAALHEAPGKRKPWFKFW